MKLKKEYPGIRAAKRKGDRNRMGKICYTAKELADMLGVSRPSIYKLLNSGEIAYRVIGGKYMINKQSFEEWMNKAPEEPEKCKKRSR